MPKTAGATELIVGMKGKEMSEPEKRETVSPASMHARSEWILIDYRHYWDAPREFVVRRGDEAYFFESLFDEARDDYSPEFRVYRIPLAVAEIPISRWDELHQIGERLGDIAVDQLRFRAEPVPGYPQGRSLRFIHESVFDILQKVRRQGNQDPSGRSDIMK